VQRIFNVDKIQDNILHRIKTEQCNILITLLRRHMYTSYDLSKMVRFYGPPRRWADDHFSYNTLCLRTETHARSVSEVETGQRAQSLAVALVVKPALRLEAGRVRKQAFIATNAV